MSESLVIEERHERVLVLRLNRPPLNPLSGALLGALAAAATRAAADPTVGAVIVTGSERAFSAGADIDEFAGPEEGRRVAASFRAACDALGAIPRPVIASVRGFALGGGCEVTLACDLRIAADNAKFGQPECLLGLVPGGGATQRLPRLVGPARAKELLWSGRQVRADEALAIGLADRVVPADELDAAALEWASGFAAGASGALGRMKRLVDDGLDGDLARGLDLEAVAFAETFATQDAAIGIESFRTEGPGKARFVGR
jgi:enoyl-CoA hydratase/carnithine racemase